MYVPACLDIVVDNPKLIISFLVTLKNNCGSNIQPVIANVNCGYSPRCDTPGSGGVVRVLRFQ